MHRSGPHTKRLLAAVLLLCVVLPSPTHAGPGKLDRARQALVDGDPITAARILDWISLTVDGYHSDSKRDDDRLTCEDRDLLSALVPIAIPWREPVDFCSSPSNSRARPPLFPHPRLKAGQHVFTTARWVHLRAQPDTDATVLDDAFIGTELEVLSADGKWGEEDGWVAVALPRIRTVEIDLRTGTSERGPIARCQLTEVPPAPRKSPLRAWVASSLVATERPDPSQLVTRAEQAQRDDDAELALMLLDRASALQPANEELRKRVVEMALAQNAASTAVWASTKDIEVLMSGEIAAGCRGDRHRARWVHDKERASAGRNACLYPIAFERPCTTEFYGGMCGVTECDEGGLDPPPDPARDARERKCFEKWAAGAAKREKIGKKVYAREQQKYRTRVDHYQKGFPDGPWAHLTLHGMRPRSDKHLFIIVGEHLSCANDTCYQADHWSLDSELMCDAGPALAAGEVMNLWVRLPSFDGVAISAVQWSADQARQLAFGATGDDGPGSIMEGPAIMAPVECQDSACAATEERQCACSAD